MGSQHARARIAPRLAARAQHRGFTPVLDEKGNPRCCARAAKWIVIVIIAIVWCARAGAQDEPAVTFANVATAPALSDADAARVAQYVGERLHQTKSVTPLPAILQNDAAPRVVFVSVSDGEEPAHVAMSAARGAVKAADGAIARVAKLLPDVADRRWIRVDIVNRVEPLATGATNLKLGIVPSLEGLELAGGIAFLPEELVGWDLVEGDRLLESSVYDYLESRPARGAAPGDAALRAVRRFTCASFFVEDDNNPTPLYRGHRAFASVTPDDLTNAAAAAGAYLIASVRPDGRFEYSYRIDRDEVPKEYNIVRHAGSIWGMLHLYQETRDEELMAAIERAMRYLLAQVRPVRIGQADVVGLAFDDEVSLGGNALAALALGTYVEATGKKEHLPIVRALGRSVLAAQNASGRFVIQRQRFSTGQTFMEDGPYAPGEGILALLKVHDVDPDPAWLDAAQRGAKYLITVRDGGVEPADLPHDHWLLYALRQLHEKRADPMYVEHAAAICRAILHQQHKPGSANMPPDAAGSWMDARSTPAAVRSEGMLAAVALMRSVGRTADADAFLNGAQSAVAFQLRTQVRPEGAMHCRNPRRAIGGFREDLGGVYVRIDYVQHNLSSIIDLMHATGAGKRR